jgi:hypothetical protein
MSNGGQRLLQVYKTTNYLKAGADECADDSLESQENLVEDDDNFEIEQTDYEIIHQNGISTDSINWIQPPSKLWRESDSKKVIEVKIYIICLFNFFFFRLVYTKIAVKTTN